MSPSPAVDALYSVLEANRLVQTLRGARDLGVFRALEEGPIPADALSGRVDVPPVRLERLLAVLESLHLVERRGSRIAANVPAPVLEELLRERDIGGALRDGPAAEGHTATGAAALYPAVVTVLARMERDIAPVVAEHLAAPGLHVLEMGAGGCAWSTALARRCPDATFVASDLPEVLQASRRAIEGAGLSDRYELLPGDFFVTDLGPPRFDLVIVPMVLHLFGEARAAGLVSRAASVVAPGGRLVFIDVFTSDDEPRLDEALYSLELLTRTAEGRVHDLGRTGRWMRDSGLVDIDATAIPVGVPVTLLGGTRPG